MEWPVDEHKVVVESLPEVNFDVPSPPLLCKHVDLLCIDQNSGMIYMTKTPVRYSVTVTQPYQRLGPCESDWQAGRDSV